MKILIDAGHNYKDFDTGAVGKISNEQDLTFAIANDLKNILIENGNEVKLTRNSVTDVLGENTVNSSLKARVQIENEYNPDYFISIHINAGGGKGCETYIYKGSKKAKELAEKIQDALVKLGRVDRGVKEASFYVLKHTKSPAVLVEVGFIDNVYEEEWMVNNTFKIAKAISTAFGEKKEEYLSVTDAISVLVKENIITDADKWYGGTWNDEDFKWLLRKVGTYIDNLTKK